MQGTQAQHSKSRFQGTQRANTTAGGGRVKTGRAAYLLYYVPWHWRPLDVVFEVVDVFVLLTHLDIYAPNPTHVPITSSWPGL